MGDLWTVISTVAAREAGHATADILRIRGELTDPALVQLEQHGGETFAGAAYRAALSVAELRRTVWRDVARNPATALMPPVAFALTRAVWSRRG